MATKTDTDSAFDDIPLVKIHQWGEEHEKILVDWADKAMCYNGYIHKQILHMQEWLMVYYTCNYYINSHRNCKFCTRKSST